MDCSDLDPDSHDLLAELTDKGWKRNQYRLFRTTVQGVADACEIPRKDARLLLGDLETQGFVVLAEEGRIQQPEGRDLPPCICEPLDRVLSEPLGSDAGRPRTHSKQRSSAEGGSGRTASPSPKETTPSRTSRARERRAESSPSKSRKRREGALSKPVEKLTAFDLAYLLGHRIREAGRTDPNANSWVKAGAVSQDPTRKQIAAWMRDDGVEPQIIREMIEVFVSDPRLLNQPLPAWKVFVNQRARLESAARRRLGGFASRRRSVESETEDLTWGDVQRRQQTSNSEH